MKFRDVECDGEHVVDLDGVTVEFGADGTVEPNPEQAAAMRATALRHNRFVVVVEADPTPEVGEPAVDVESAGDVSGEPAADRRRRYRRDPD